MAQARVTQHAGDDAGNRVPPVTDWLQHLTRVQEPVRIGALRLAESTAAVAHVPRDRRLRNRWRSFITRANVLAATQASGPLQEQLSHPPTDATQRRKFGGTGEVLDIQSPTWIIHW
jgi:hypothetical protein